MTESGCLSLRDLTPPMTRATLSLTLSLTERHILRSTKKPHLTAAQLVLSSKHLLVVPTRKLFEDSWVGNLMRPTPLVEDCSKFVTLHYSLSLTEAQHQSELSQCARDVWRELCSQRAVKIISLSEWRLSRYDGLLLYPASASK